MAALAGQRRVGERVILYRRPAQMDSKTAYVYAHTVVSPVWGSRQSGTSRASACGALVVVLVVVRQLCRTRRTRFKPLALGHCKNSTPGFNLSKVVDMASVGGTVLLLPALTVGGVYISATPKTAIRHHEEESNHDIPVV